MRVSLDEQSSNRTVYPTSDPILTPISCARALAQHRHPLRIAQGARQDTETDASAGGHVGHLGIGKVQRLLQRLSRLPRPRSRVPGRAGVRHGDAETLRRDRAGDGDGPALLTGPRRRLTLPHGEGRD